MPPKGWRKNAGFIQKPDTELVSIDEILFPRSTVQKLAKNITAGENNDGGMIVSKDSLIALQRSATVFVSHMMFHARKIAKDADRKTVNAQDIIQALERAELSGFVPEVKQRLTTYEHGVELKKQQRAEAKTDEPVAKKLKDNLEAAVEINAEEVEEVDEDETEVNTIDEDDDMEPEKEEDEASALNPIALLGKDEEELGGDNNEEKQEEDSSDENND